MISSSTTSVTTAATNTTTPASSEAILSSDYETFLKMLTTQAQNQDPLNPIDSSDYAAQLATFSSVEQQVVTNDLLQNMMSLLSVGGLGDLASWVGREVRSDAPGYFDGAPLSLAVTTVTGADTSQLEVRDAAGNLKQSHPLTPGQARFEWAGVDEFGAPLPMGEYSFSVENFSNGESVGVTSVATYNRVQEARVDNGQTYLVLNGGHVLATDSVTGIRG